MLADYRTSVVAVPSSGESTSAMAAVVAASTDVVDVQTVALFPVVADSIVVVEAAVVGVAAADIATQPSADDWIAIAVVVVAVAASSSAGSA